MIISNIKKEFPIFSNKIHNNDLVYLDSANSSQKPQTVINRVNEFYTNEFSNTGRSVHYLAVAATNLYENTRSSVQKYINAKDKNEINCNLNDQYSSAFINGIIKLKNSQHHEIKTNINHLAENTKSYQLIKSVLNDNAKGIYQGKIYVDSKAQKTNGYQLSKAILLNENTEFDGKPELEIYADDVKCSHGATSGNLDEDAIFYLMSRGLSQQQSKELLINGFLLDAVEKITDSEIKDLIKDMIGITE